MVDKRHIALVLLALAASPAWGQAPIAPATAGGGGAVAVGPSPVGGSAVSPASTGQPIDPTKNVLDLVQAAIARQDDLRNAEARFQNAIRELERSRQEELRKADFLRIADLREADVRRLNELREAETRRVNELATQKQIFDLELARVIRAGLDASTLLLATQLKEVKTDASDRMAKLEQFANEQRGRASADLPVNTKLLEEVRLLTQAQSRASGVDTGSTATWALIGSIIVMVLMLGGFVIAFFNMKAKR